MVKGKSDHSILIIGMVWSSLQVHLYIVGFCLFVVQSVRAELAEKVERDTTGLESLLEGDQESFFISGGKGDKGSGGK